MHKTYTSKLWIEVHPAVAAVLEKRYELLACRVFIVRPETPTIYQPLYESIARTLRLAAPDDLVIARRRFGTQFKWMSIVPPHPKVTP